MSTDNSYQWRKQLLWGLLLIGFGAAIFLDRLDILEVDELWHYSPLVLVVVGVNQMIGYPTARDFTRGLWNVFIGGWLFAIFEGMYGLSFSNGWPFLIIAWGISLILEPFIQRRFAANRESSNEK